MRQTAQNESSLISAANAGSMTNWNLAELLERLDNDHDFLRELLAIFREDSRINLQKARAALQARDLPELTRAAHTMKGMLRNLSMDCAAEIAYALESSAREEQYEIAQASFARLEEALTALVPEVEAQLAVGVKK
jgi:HPt (histidine-containing phosphotransfer) domain-containing protein